MRIGIGTGVTSPLCVGRNRTLRSLFRPSDAGFWLDPATIGTMSQDIAGAVPVSMFGQAVGRIVDRSGKGRHATQAVAAARPTYARMPVGGRRNMLPNSGGSGAILGVIGSGGALPTGYAMAATLTRQVVEIGEIGGIPYFDIRLTGTLTGSYFVDLSPSTAVPAADGQTWVSSIYAQFLGTVTGVSALTLTPSARTTAGAGKADYPSVSIGLPTSFTRFTTPAATLLNSIGAGTVQFFLGYLRLTCTGAVNVTLRFGGRQVERANAATIFQTVNGAADITQTGQASRFALLDDLVDDTLAATLPAGTYTVATGDDDGVTILTGQALSGAYTIPGPRRLYGALVINRALKATEIASLTVWLNARRP